jgi:hypothetical protein
MSQYVLMDSGGNLIEAYDDHDEAHAALRRIVADEPEAAAHVALVIYDDHGNPTSDAVTVNEAGVLGPHESSRDRTSTL